MDAVFHFLVFFNVFFSEFCIIPPLTGRPLTGLPSHFFLIFFAFYFENLHPNHPNLHPCVTNLPPNHPNLPPFFALGRFGGVLGWIGGGLVVDWWWIGVELVAVWVVVDGAFDGREAGRQRS